MYCLWTCAAGCTAFGGLYRLWRSRLCLCWWGVLTGLACSGLHRGVWWCVCVCMLPRNGGMHACMQHILWVIVAVPVVDEGKVVPGWGTCPLPPCHHHQMQTGGSCGLYLCNPLHSRCAQHATHAVCVCVSVCLWGGHSLCTLWKGEGGRRVERPGPGAADHLLSMTAG